MKQNTTLSQMQPFMLIANIDDFERLENQGEDHVIAQFITRDIQNLSPYFPEHRQNPLPQTIPRQKQQIDIPFFAKPVDPCSDILPDTKSITANPETRMNRTNSYKKYIHHQPYDMSSSYELREEDFKFLEEYNKTHIVKLTEYSLESAIQHLELQHHFHLYVAFKPGEGIDPGRNFQRQWELLHSLQSQGQLSNPEIVSYWQVQTDKLLRPLLRVFMRALENDQRTQIAFRPTKPYKQKRLKRIGMPLQEFESIEKKFRTENTIALHSSKMVVHRESLKKDLMQIQKLKWIKQSQDEDHMEQEMIEENLIETNFDKTKQLQEQAKDLNKQLKEQRLETKLKLTLPSSPVTLIKSKSEFNAVLLPPSHTKFKDCLLEDCQFNLFQDLEPTYLTPQLMEIMTDQFAMLKWKGCQVDRPENPIVLRKNCIDILEDQDTLVIRPQSLIGSYMLGNQMIIGTEEKSKILRESRNELDISTQKFKKTKKTVSITFIDNKLGRMSTQDGIKVDYDHFVHHQLEHSECGQKEVETIKKLCQKNRLEALRLDRQIKLKLLKKKRTDELLKRRKNILKIRLKLEDLVIKKSPPMEHQTPTKRPHKVLSSHASANRIILRKFDIDAEKKTKLSCIQESPSKFRLVYQISPSTLKLQLGQESHESGSLETHPRNVFNFSASKPIDDFNTKNDTT